MERDKLITAIENEEHRICSVKRRIDALVIKRENLKKECEEKLKEMDDLINMLEESCVSGFNYIDSCKRSLEMAS